MSHLVAKNPVYLQSITNRSGNSLRHGCDTDTLDVLVMFRGAMVVVYNWVGNVRMPLKRTKAKIEEAGGRIVPDTEEDVDDALVRLNGDYIPLESRIDDRHYGMEVPER